MSRGQTDVEEFDVDYDLVVVGSGGSGLSAAVEAAHRGLRVALVEKNERLGGSSALAEGPAAFESEEQAARGITVTKAEGFQRIMEYSHWHADPAIVSRFVDNAATTIRKMKEVGVSFMAVTRSVPGSDELDTWHLPEGLGAKVIETYAAEARRCGVDIFTSTRARSLVRAPADAAPSDAAPSDASPIDEGGSGGGVGPASSPDGAGPAPARVIGLVAEDADGEQVRLGAAAVVIASGGYAGDPELYNRYAPTPVGADLIIIGNPTSTGDGLRMVLEAGGATSDRIGTQAHCPIVRGTVPYGPTFGAGVLPFVWLDASGRRFIDETAGIDWAVAGDIAASQPGFHYWAVMDQGLLQGFAAAHRDRDQFGLYGKLQGELDAIANGDVAVYRADTLEELAGRMGVSPAVLADEVDAYNAACRDGRDRLFHKDPAELKPLTGGPYYALKMETGDLISMGGIKIDDHMHCLTSDRRIIPGLYAVGCDAGGLFGDAYSLVVPGTANGFAYTSGWLAADDIADRLEADRVAVTA